MKELEEIKRRLGVIKVCQNGFVKVEDVRNVINFIDGIIFFTKENEEDEC